MKWIPSTNRQPLDRPLVVAPWKVAVVRWDARTGKCLGSKTFGPSFGFSAFSPDARYVVLQDKGDEGPAIFEIATGNKPFALGAKGGFVFSDDGRRMAMYDGDQVLVWDISSGKVMQHVTFGSSCLPRLYPDYKNRLSFSPDKRILAVGGFTDIGMVGLIDLESGKILDKFRCCPASMFCEFVEFAPYGGILATDTATMTDDDRVVEPILRFWKVRRIASTVR